MQMTKEEFLELIYADGVRWIARNDEALCMDESAIAETITVNLLADLVDKHPGTVAEDIVSRRKYIFSDRKIPDDIADAILKGTAIHMAILEPDASGDAQERAQAGLPFKAP
jgi:hypothetical protein